MYVCMFYVYVYVLMLVDIVYVLCMCGFHHMYERVFSHDLVVYVFYVALNSA